jgi:hypothetical protein
LQRFNNLWLSKGKAVAMLKKMRTEKQKENRRKMRKQTKENNRAKIFNNRMEGLDRLAMQKINNDNGKKN